MTIKEAHQQLKKAFPHARYISVNVDTHWWQPPWDKAEVEYTVAVNDGDRRYQESCVSDLNAAVVTIIGSATPTLPTDLDAVSRQVAAMQDIHGADGLAEMSNDNGQARRARMLQQRWRRFEDVTAAERFRTWLFKQHWGGQGQNNVQNQMSHQRQAAVFVARNDRKCSHRSGRDDRVQ